MKNINTKWKMIGSYRKYKPTKRVVKRYSNYAKYGIKTEIVEEEIVDKIDYQNFEVDSHFIYKANFYFISKIEYQIKGQTSFKEKKILLHTQECDSLTTSLKSWEWLEDNKNILTNDNIITILESFKFNNQWQ